MELLALNCQHCSAPLKVPAGAKFVTCTHCGSQLVVRQTGSVAYTELLEAIDARTERMAEQIDELHQRSEIADLDRRWEQERESYYIERKDGRRSLPTRTGSIAGGVIIAGFGTLWTIIACGIGAGFTSGPGPFSLVGMIFPLFGLVFIASGLWMSWHSYQKAEAFERAKARYLRERAQLGDAMPHEEQIGPSFDA